MTLEELGYISQIIGLVAVFASLIFVGLQIRQNTKAIKARSHHAVTDSFNAINNLILSDPKVARIGRAPPRGTRAHFARSFRLPSRRQNPSDRR
jgi:hypothetical protein